MNVRPEVEQALELTTLGEQIVGVGEVVRGEADLRAALTVADTKPLDHHQIEDAAAVLS